MVGFIILLALITAVLIITEVFMIFAKKLDKTGWLILHSTTLTSAVLTAICIIIYLIH